MILTIFTPLYNREISIRAVYNSLCSQTSQHFQWLVINDGSTDKSGVIMDDIISHHDGNFTIRYYSQENLGLTRTINRALELVDTPLMMRLDSDDVAMPKAIEQVDRYYPYIENDDNLCALVFRSDLPEGERNGYHPFVKPTICDFNTYRDKWKATGDRAEIMKTKIYKNYKFPVFDGEKFCPEGLVWNRIAQKYDALYLCESVYEKGTPNDSITADVYNHLMRSCKGTSLYYFELVNNNQLSYRYRLSQLVRYYRYAPFAHFPLFKGIPLSLFVIGFPLGMAVLLRDRCLYNRSR